LKSLLKYGFFCYRVHPYSLALHIYIASLLHSYSINSVLHLLSPTIRDIFPPSEFFLQYHNSELMSKVGTAMICVSISPYKVKNTEPKLILECMQALSMPSVPNTNLPLDDLSNPQNPTRSSSSPPQPLLIPLLLLP
jgi:hypothetical protein